MKKQIATCDRCWKAADVISGSLPTRWITITVAGTQLDLCDSCEDDLNHFLSNPPSAIKIKRGAA